MQHSPSDVSVGKVCITQSEQLPVTPVLHVWFRIKAGEGNLYLCCSTGLTSLVVR